MVSLKIDGIEKKVKKGTTIEEIGKELGLIPGKNVILSEYNGSLRELSTKVNEDGDLRFIDIGDQNGMRTYRRSAVMLLQAAIKEYFRDDSHDINVLFSISGGYYCVFEDKTEVTNELLESLQKIMEGLVEADIPITKTTMKTVEARALFKELGAEKKERLLRYRSDSLIYVYELKDTKDYFYGYMAPSTGYIRHFRLYKFKEGFAMQFPTTENLNRASDFDPPLKLFKVLNDSITWADKLGIPTVGALNDLISTGKIQDVILMQEALMEGNLADIAREIVGRGGVKFIMIAGPSSSGKTTFSHRLSIHLKSVGLTPHPVPLDDYYLNRDQMPLDEFGQKDFEALEGLDIERFNKDMQSLLKGKETELPIFDFKTGKRKSTGRMLKLGEDDVLVIEGIHGLNDKLSYSLPLESKFKIYISALTMLAIDEHNPLSRTDGRLLRRIVRDARTRGTSAKETLAMWDSVKRGEKKNIFPFQESADIMVNTALIYELAVMKLFCEPQLYAIEQNEPEYAEAKRLIKLLKYVLPMSTEDIPNNSLIREFIGGSIFKV